MKTKLSTIVIIIYLIIFTNYANAGVRVIAISDDGRYLASGGISKDVKIWEANSGKNIHTLKGHTSEITAIDFSPNNLILLTGSLDNSIKLWNINSGKLIRTFIAHEGGITSAQFSPDGLKIISGGDNNIKIWSISNNSIKLFYSFEMEKAKVNSISVSQDCKFVLAGGENILNLWDISTHNLIRTFEIKTKTIGILSTAFADGGNKVIAGINPSGGGGIGDETIIVFNVNTGNEINRFRHSNAATSIAISPDGKKVFVCGFGTQDVDLWTIENGEKIRTFPGRNDSGNNYSVAYSKNGQKVAMGGDDGTIRTWDSNTGEELLIIYHWDNKVKNKYVARKSQKIEIEAIKPLPDATNTVSVKPAQPADRTPPEIIIYEPNVKEHGIHIIKKKMILIRGKSTDESGIYEVLVNGIEANISANGEFQANIPLVIGSNEIYIKATDGKQNTAEKSFAVEREDESQIPLSETVSKTKQMEKGNSIPTIPQLIKNLFPNTKTWAVVIGIDKYSQNVNGFDPLPYAVSDAEAIKKYLIKYMGLKEERISQLYNENATKHNIEKLLGDELPKLIPNNDRLIVYFSGHGETLPVKGENNTDNKQGYLIPIDGNKKVLYATCVSMKHIRDFCDLIPARQIVFIIDACYSGIAGVIHKGEGEEKLKKINFEDITQYMNDRMRQIMTGVIKSVTFHTR